MMRIEVHSAATPSGRSAPAGRAHAEPVGEIDLRALWTAIKRRRRAILSPTILAFVLVGFYVQVATPRYTAQSQLLLENQETFFTRPDRTPPSDQASQVDQEAVASQVQLIASRDLARRAIRELGLKGDPEFDPLARVGAINRVLILLGLAHDPSREGVDARMTKAFADRLTVYSPPKTRVIAIEFTSRDAELAARGANLVADLYLREQSAAKRANAKQAADALATQIGDLRAKLADADAQREAYRSRSGLLAGGNNMTVSGQQLADINTDLSKARTTQADARAKASILRDLLREGDATDVSDVVNDASVRLIAQQRVLAQAQLAESARTLLPGHPRMKELAGQVAQFDLALKAAAKQAVATLENDARIAGQRVANLEAVLSTSKQAVGVANTDEVRLHALERNAQSFKDQLESSTTKYQEALARQSSAATPADARIIARATVPQEPAFPKKVPFTAFGTVAAFVFALGAVVAGELLSGRVAAPLDEHGDQRPVISMGAPADPSPAPVSATRERIDVHPDRVDAAPSRGMPPTEPTASRGLLAAAVAYLRLFGQSAASSRVGGEAIDHHAGAPDTVLLPSGPAPVQAAPDMDRALAIDAAPGMEDIAAIVERIVAVHRPGHGLQVVGTSLGDAAGDTLTDLGRRLSSRGRSIIVDLNRTPVKLAAMVAPEAGGHPALTAMPGLSELLAGTQSFAEVIHRDHASRLHFIPTGMLDADFRDFDLVLDALAETYDFIVLLAPAFPQNEIAKVMAPYADVVVLASGADADDELLYALEDELIEAGARDVMLVGRAARPSDRVREVA